MGMYGGTGPLKGRPYAHGHVGWTLLLDKKAVGKLKAAAKKSVLMWPQSPSKKKENISVKGHDFMAQWFRDTLEIKVVDTNVAKYEDSQTVEEFAACLREVAAET